MADQNSDPIRVLVCDDYFLIRAGVKSAISHDPDVEIVAEAGTAEEAIRLVGDMLPDVVIMDIALPAMDGIQATRKIKSAHPSVAVIALTRYEDIEHIMEIYRSGAAGYLMKNVEADELLSTIHAVSGGRVLLHARVAGKIIETFADVFTSTSKVDAAGLSAREMEVLALVGQSKSNKEIASILNISPRTAQNHLANIFRKLEINDRISAAIYAINQGFGQTDVSNAVGPVAGLSRWGVGRVAERPQLGQRRGLRRTDSASDH